VSIIDSRFYKRVTNLAGIRILAGVLVLVTVPVLTRTYTPTQYGQWVVWFSLCVLLSSVSSLGYAQAIVLPKLHKHGALLVRLAIACCLLVGSTGALVYCAIPEDLLLALGIPQSAAWSIGFGLVVTLTGINESLGSWNIRREKFSVYAQAQAVATAGVPACQIGLAYVVGASEITLVIGTVLSLLMSLVLLLTRGGLGLTKHAQQSVISWKKEYISSKQYDAYPKFMVAYNLVGTFRERFIFFLLGQTNSLEAGLFGLAHRVVQVPKNLMASSVKPVFYQIAARADIRKLENEIQGFLLAAVKVMIPVWVLFLFSSEAIFSFLFGEEWRQAGAYAAIISFVAIPNIMCACFDRVFDVTGRQKVAFRLELGFSILLAISISLAALADSPMMHIVVVQSVVLTLYFFVYLFFIYYVAGYSLGGFWKIQLAIFLLAVVSVLYFLFLNWTTGEAWASVIYASTVGICIARVVLDEFKKFGARKECN